MGAEQNYFALFGLPQSFQVDKAALTERYREIQKQNHPDRFASAGDQAQRLAVQQTALLNDALATLKSPLKRAGYLLKLAGRDIKPEATGPMDPAFLMQQMELREALENADHEDALDELRDQVEADWQQILAEFEGLLANDLEQAEQCYRRMQFLNKLLKEIDQREDELADY